MNKILILSLAVVFIVIVFSLEVEAGSAWKYVWNNTSITIPVGESFDKFKNLPTATLYRDNVALEDASITYNTEGDWLYYSKNVNTSKVGTYKVWYKAYESNYIPGTCTDYKCLVTFYVKDLVNPTIKALNNEINVQRGSDYDLMNNISVVDNYSDNITVEFSENNIFDTVGTYNITAKAIDESGNVSEVSFIVNVFDNSKPIIECTSGSDIYIPLNGEYDIKSSFKATDLNDGDITNKIVFPNIKNDIVDEYEYTVSVENSVGNKCEYKVYIHVIDDVEPKIILKSNNVILDYKVDLASLDLKSYISKIEDNKIIDYSNLTITHNIINKVGSYSAYFEYDDGYYIAEETLNISLVSHEAPKIKTDEINLTVESYVDLTDYITVVDDSDSNISNSLIVDDSDLNYDKEGTYYVSAYCINSSGLSTEKRIRVTVKKEETSYSGEHKSYSYTTIILVVIIAILVIVKISYIIISKKSKISNNKNDLNI